MDAVVIAGGTPAPGDPLYPFTNGRPKAMLDMAGKPMIQWVLDALDGAESIERVAIAGLKDETGFHCEKLFTRLESNGGIIENIRYGVAELSRDHSGTRSVSSVCHSSAERSPRSVPGTGVSVIVNRPPSTSSLSSVAYVAGSCAPASPK